MSNDGSPEIPFQYSWQRVRRSDRQSGPPLAILLVTTRTDSTYSERTVLEFLDVLGPTIIRDVDVELIFVSSSITRTRETRHHTHFLLTLRFRQRPREFDPRQLILASNQHTSNTTPRTAPHHRIYRLPDDIIEDTDRPAGAA